MAEKFPPNGLNRYKNGRFKRKQPSSTISKAPEDSVSVSQPSLDHTYSRTEHACDMNHGWSDSDDDSDGDSVYCEKDGPVLEPIHEDISRNLNDWREGRRIVELGVLASNLQKGCDKCGRTLQLFNCVQERHYGLGSLLYIVCKSEGCGHITCVSTGKRHVKGVWDVNTKLGTGVSSSGIGFSALTLLLAALNIPGITPSTFKKRDRESGKAIEAVASNSCTQALEEEFQMTEGNEGIRVSADAGWQTRSSGRKYNSFSVKWPRGTYTLVKPKTGCPAGWLEGWRFQDNENDANQNRVSYGHHFYGIIGTHPRDLNTSYCTKDLNDSNHEGYWPRGNYCILKHGSVCPPGGFRTGIVYWDDEDSNNKNRAGGELPRGIFNSNTMVYYCCRNDGLYSNAIRLPKSKPFYLLRHNIYSYCQQVEGMNVREETVYTDDQDGRNGNWVAGSTPYGPSDGKRNYRLYYCYYYSI